MNPASDHAAADRPLYNSRIIDTYLRLLRRRYGHVDIDALLEHAGMTAYEVADPGHWFSQQQIDRFHDRLAAVTHNPGIAREAGRYAASQEALGPLRPYVLGMIHPAAAYRLIGKAASQFTRATRFVSRQLSATCVEIIVTAHHGVTERPFQCANRIGFIESIALGFTGRLPRVEHTQCQFTGGNACHYVVQWEEGAVDRLIRWRAGILAMVLLAALLASGLHPSLALPLFLPVALTLVLMVVLVGAHFSQIRLRTSLDHLSHTADQLIAQAEHGHNNTVLVSQVSQLLSAQSSVPVLIETLIGVFQQRLDFDRGMVLMVSPEGEWLQYQAGFGYDETQLALLHQSRFHLDNPVSRGVFVTAFRQQRPFLINDIDIIAPQLSARSLEFARRLGAKSFICTPIISSARSVGVLAVDNLRSKRPLLKSDLSLMFSVANILGMSIHTIELAEARQRQFNSILQALAATIDARDPLTSGHSARVTEFAVGICEQMGLSKDYREMMQVAALLHDYGKIGVPDAILKKPGQLNDEESSIVRHHAVKTRDILERIAFEGVFAQVPVIAGAHHEKLDGSGYPLGLRGEEIPMGSRIIAVADFFEAITSQRHYRNPMTPLEAVRLLREQADAAFDRQVVDAFLRYFSQAHSEIFPQTPND